MKRLQLNIRQADEDEQLAFQAAAARARLSVSEWARLILCAASGHSALPGQLERAQEAASAAEGRTAPRRAQKRR